MAYAASSAISAAPSSIARARGTLTQALYLKRVSRLLETSPDVIISQLVSIRDALARVSNFRVLVIANLHVIAKPVTSWEILTASLPASGPLEPLPTPLSRLSAKGVSPGSSAFIIPLPTIDSSFAVCVARGPSSLRDPSIPALLVAFAYLEAVEGPLWTAVRGTGLAYGASFSRNVESGHISFNVYRSPNVLAAFSASKNVVEDFVKEKKDFDVLALEGAISSIVLGIANGQASMASAAQGNFTRQVFQGLPEDWNEQILKLVRDVSVAEIRTVMEEVVLPVFEGATSNLIITCAPIMAEVSSPVLGVGLDLSSLLYTFFVPSLEPYFILPAPFTPSPRYKCPLIQSPTQTVLTAKYCSGTGHWVQGTGFQPRSQATGIFPG